MSVAIVALIVAVAGYYTIALQVAEPPWPMTATGSPPADGGAGNVLQPIAADLTWIYRTRGIWPRGVMRMTVVGREFADGEDRWLIEQWVGLPEAVRYLIVNREGELWVLATERIGDDGEWQRSVLAGPQLWQPDAAGPRTWTSEVSGPGRAISSDMRRGGTRVVLGTRRQLWLIEDHNPGILAEPLLTTVAEGVGPIEFDGPSYDGSGPLRLVEFRTTPPPLSGTFEARSRHGTAERGRPTL